MGSRPVSPDRKSRVWEEEGFQITVQASRRKALEDKTRTNTCHTQFSVVATFLSDLLHPLHHAATTNTLAPPPLYFCISDQPAVVQAHQITRLVLSSPVRLVQHFPRCRSTDAGPRNQDHWPQQTSAPLSTLKTTLSYTSAIS